MDNLTAEHLENMNKLLFYFKMKLLQSLYPTKKTSEKLDLYDKEIIEYKPLYYSNQRAAKFQKIYSYLEGSEDNKNILRLIKLISKLLNNDKCSFWRYDYNNLTIEVTYNESGLKSFSIVIKMTDEKKVMAKIKTTLLRS